MRGSGFLAGLLVLGCVSVVSALEPQAVVGAWVGQWNDGLGVTDAVYVPATQVSGDRAEGTVFWKVAAGTPSANQELLFVGTLVGNTLSVRGAPTVPGSPPMSSSCSINQEGPRMDGFFQAARRWAVSLAKTKP